MRIERDQIPVSDKLDDMVEKKLNVLYREQRVKRIRNTMIGMGTAAACFMGVIAVGVANPAWASQLPLIGHIFEQMGSDFGYPGDYSQKGTLLETESGSETLSEGKTNTSEQKTDSAETEIQVTEGQTTEAQTTEAQVTEVQVTEVQVTEAQTAKGQTTAAQEAGTKDTQYTKTVGDMTVTLSEVYCNGQALNIAVVLKSKNPFPETQKNVDGKPLISCRTREDYSFNPQEQSDLVYLDGDFMDENTFAGLLRFDLNMKNTDDSAFCEALDKMEAEGVDGANNEELSDADLNYEELVKKVEIPKNFTLKLALDEIEGYLAEPEIREMDKTPEELEAMSDQEWEDYMTARDQEDPSWSEFPNAHENYWFDGSWDFELEISQNTDECVTVQIGTTNEDGAGMEKIEKTPFEITMYPIDPRSNEEIWKDGYSYLPVMLDADGMLMDVGRSGGVIDTVAVGDHDVSMVDVYLFRDTEWLDEIKEYWYSNAEALQKGEKLEDGRTFKEVCDERAVYHETVKIPAE